MGNEGCKQFHAAEWSVIKERGQLKIISKTIFLKDDMELPWEGSVETVQGTLTITHATFNGDIPKERNVACLDADRLHLPLTLRSTRNGDRFAPFGMQGTKLVSDYLTDRKKSRIEKQMQLVVVDTNGEIVWLVNERPSSRCCISKETKNVIRFEWRG